MFARIRRRYSDSVKSGFSGDALTGKFTATVDPAQGVEFSRAHPGQWRDWTVEPGIRRVVNGLPNRVDRVRALGNSIVPQIAFMFFSAIRSIESILEK